MTTARGLRPRDTSTSEGEWTASGHVREVWMCTVFNPASGVDTAGPPSLVSGTTVAGGGGYVLLTASLPLPGPGR